MKARRRLGAAVGTLAQAAFLSVLFSSLLGAPAQSARGCPPSILDGPTTHEVGDLVALEGLCCAAPVPALEWPTLAALLLVLLLSGLVSSKRRTSAAARVLWPALIASPALLYAPSLGAQSCEAELEWEAQSASELFSGSGPTFAFMPTQPGLFVVTLRSGSDESTREIDVLLPLTCVDAGDADPTGTGVWVDALGQAAVTIPDPAACARGYSLTSTAPSIGGTPAPRAVAEAPGAPTLRTGHLMFDALYTLALDDLAGNEVASLIDPIFDGGTPQPCPAGGCYRSSSVSDTLGTREAGFAAHLGSLALDAVRARNALELRLSELRGGGAPRIVQDFGSGGSYPVGSDRVAWALGASSVLALLEGGARDAFAASALAALENTLEQDRLVLHDASDGLYRGESSYLDLREQSYPARVATDVAEIAGSKALSTNLLHLHALELASALADEAGDTALRDRYAAWSSSLRTAIHDGFWDAGAGLFSTFTSSSYDPARVRRWDLLGSALAVLLGVANAAEADSVLAAYPHYGPAAPLIWPQQQTVPIQHNRGASPMVSAYWLRAAALAGNDAVAERMIGSLARAAALNLSNVWALEAETGAARVDEGAESGPYLNATRRLGSIAGYLSMIHHTLFGLHVGADGLHVRPFVTAGLRTGLFAGTRRLVLNDARYRTHDVTVVLHLPDTAGTGPLETVAVHLNGSPIAGDLVPAALLQASNRVDVFLASGTLPPATITEASTADLRDLFGPRTPRVVSVMESSGDLEVGLDRGGESPGDVTFRVLRDGAVVADGLPGSTTSWADGGVDPSGPRSYCYVAESTFVLSGNHSQHSAPGCWLGASFSHVTVIDAASMSNVGGTLTFDHGRWHWSGWGDAGHSLTVPSFVAAQSGRHQLLVRYGNGAGPVASGITCAAKRIVVEDVAASTVVAEGAVVMPHLGAWEIWADSTPLTADLVAGRSYRITIRSDDDMENMSVLEHFATYDGVGGASGAFNRANVTELVVLAR